MDDLLVRKNAFQNQIKLLEVQIKDFEQSYEEHVGQQKKHHRSVSVIRQNLILSIKDQKQNRIQKLYLQKQQWIELDTLFQAKQDAFKELEEKYQSMVDNIELYDQELLDCLFRSYEQFKPKIVDEYQIEIKNKQKRPSSPNRQKENQQPPQDVKRHHRQLSLNRSFSLRKNENPLHIHSNWLQEIKNKLNQSILFRSDQIDKQFKLKNS